MKSYFAFLVTILFVVSMVSATDIWYIADNKGTVQDIMLMQGVTSVVPTKGFSTFSKMNEEVDADDLKNPCMSVFIFKNTALLVASPTCDNIAKDVKTYLEKRKATVITKRANEITHDNLIEELGNKNLDPKCVDTDGVITYGDLEMISGCIGNTLFKYSCDGDELVEYEEDCHFGCENSACITAKTPEPVLNEEPEVTPEPTTEIIPVENQEPEPRGFVTRIVSFFKKFKFW